MILRVLYLLLILNFSSCCGQNRITQNMNEVENDSIKISISKADFNNLIDTNLSQMEKGNQLTITDYIELVRVVNSIDHYSIKESKAKELVQLFYKDYFEKAIKILETKDWKGGCQYSKKYNIFIGGKAHYNSQYYIEDQ